MRMTATPTVFNVKLMDSTITTVRNVCVWNLQYIKSATAVKRSQSENLIFYRINLLQSIWNGRKAVSIPYIQLLL